MEREQKITKVEEPKRYDFGDLYIQEQPEIIDKPVIQPDSIVNVMNA